MTAQTEVINSLVTEGPAPVLSINTLEYLYS